MSATSAASPMAGTLFKESEVSELPALLYRNQGIGRFTDR